MTIIDDGYRPTYLERYSQLIQLTEEYRLFLPEGATGEVIHTGGGCFAYEITMPNGWMAWITDTDCDVVDVHEETPTHLGFYCDDGNDFVGWTPNMNMVDALTASAGFQEYGSGEWPMAIFDSAVNALLGLKMAAVFEEDAQHIYGPFPIWGDNGDIVGWKDPNGNPVDEVRL